MTVQCAYRAGCTRDPACTDHCHAMDPAPRYSCFVAGCPGDHPSKYAVCAKPDIPLASNPVGIWRPVTPGWLATLIRGYQQLGGARTVEDSNTLAALLELQDRRSQVETAAEPDPGFQGRVYDWMAGCFARPGALLLEQRSFRFIEEALELVQAAGTSREDALRLVEYVYGRPSGVVAQEIGGVMVTLAGLATSAGLSMAHAANAELARCRENTEKIRAKDLAKPQRSPLPGSSVKTPDDPACPKCKTLLAFEGDACWACSKEER